MIFFYDRARINQLVSLYNWVYICRDDQIILNGLLFYYGYTKLEQSHHMPIWRTDGIIMTALLQTGPVEFLYYWLHRALHHHFLYSRYHSHHHSSIVTEPITCKSSQFQQIHLINFQEHLTHFSFLICLNKVVTCFYI